MDFLIVVVCLIVNAFFSAYEMAFVTVSRDEIEELENKALTQKKLIHFKKKPERTLSVIQIGITLVGAIAAAVGGTGAVDSLEPWLVQNFSLSRSFAEGVAVTVVILPLTYFSVVFGELVPKTFALKHPLKVIELGTSALSLIDRILSPVVTFLEISTNFLLKLFGLNTEATEDESMGEIVEIGNLPEYHQKFVQNLVSLKGRKVVKAMIPWDKVSYVNFGDKDELVKEKVYSTPHSRFPVVDSDIIVGILLKKEFSFLSLVNEDEHKVKSPWQGNLYPALKVKENDKILEALLKMQEKKTPLAIVEDSHEKFVGILTIEDIIEEVVGDIDDNTDYSKASKLLANRIHINIKKN